MEGIKKKLTQLRVQADEAYLRETEAKEEAAKARQEAERVREISLQRKTRAQLAMNTFSKLAPAPTRIRGIIISYFLCACASAAGREGCC